MFINKRNEIRDLTEHKRLLITKTSEDNWAVKKQIFTDVEEDDVSKGEDPLSVSSMNNGRVVDSVNFVSTGGVVVTSLGDVVMTNTDDLSCDFRLRQPLKTFYGKRLRNKDFPRYYLKREDFYSW